MKRRAIQSANDGFIEPRLKSEDDLTERRAPNQARSKTVFDQIEYCVIRLLLLALLIVVAYRLIDNEIHMSQHGQLEVCYSASIGHLTKGSSNILKRHGRVMDLRSRLVPRVREASGSYPINEHCVIKRRFRHHRAMARVAAILRQTAITSSVGAGY